MSLHLTIKDPESNPRLVISRVPGWFDAIAAYPWHWPLWKWYQQVMCWWWKRLDTYPSVKISITQEQRQQISERIWAQRQP